MQVAAWFRLIVDLMANGLKGVFKSLGTRSVLNLPIKISVGNCKTCISEHKIFYLVFWCNCYPSGCHYFIFRQKEIFLTLLLLSYLLLLLCPV